MKQRRTNRALLLPIATALGAASFAFAPARTAPDREVAHGFAESVKSAVVAVLTVDPSEPDSGRLCSGVLVAPNLVLTARHCVAKSSVDAPSCDSRGRSHDGDRLRDVPASRISIYTGERADFAAEPTARVREVVHSGSTVVCDADIAYLVLDAPIAGARTLPVRTTATEDGTASSGDYVVSIGYGGGVTNELGLRAIRDVRPIAAVGPFEDASSGKVLGPREMEIAGATCQGDSGGPAIDVLRGDVVAVASRGAGCSDEGNHVFTRVEPFDGLLAKARAAAAL